MSYEFVSATLLKGQVIQTRVIEGDAGDIVVPQTLAPVADGNVRVLIDRVFDSDRDHIFYCLQRKTTPSNIKHPIYNSSRESEAHFDHEDECNQSRKVFLRESCDVADKRTRVKRHEQQENDSNPEANPESEFQIVQLIVSVERLRPMSKEFGSDLTMVCAYLQKSTMMVSKTKTGPVEPSTVSGCPEKKP